MSICDSCRDPGACCAGFILFDATSGVREPIPFSFWLSDGPLAPLIRMAEWWMPFVPATRSDTYYNDDGGYYSIQRWGCPLLGEDGRCTDYDNRPELCRRYEAKSDTLCVEFEPVLEAAA